MVVCSDIAGQVRGKGFPAAERPGRLRRGVGWTPTNVQITGFNIIADSPYGARGDLLLVPDESTETCVDFEDSGPIEHFMIGDIVQLDGTTPWACCTRAQLGRALAELRDSAGLELLAAFEHEFYYDGAEQSGWHGYGLGSYRQGAQLAETLTAALRQAGLTPDTFMAEYGPCQFEATVAPAPGLRAADECLIFRELARASARRLGQRVSFSPLVTPEVVGNGLHIHMSLRDRHGSPVTYDPAQPQGLSAVAGSFFAGIVRYMPLLTALTAPSVISYQRLVPHRWSAAFNNMAVQDREAGLRICPLLDLTVANADKNAAKAAQFNLEYRAADASASPYIQLAALVHAGLQGIKDRLPPPTPTEGDLSGLPEQQLAALGIQKLPASLDDALARLRGCELASRWFSAEFIDVYLRHKLAEIAAAKALDRSALIARYAAVY